MFPQYPLRFGILSSLRGTGLTVSADPVSAVVIQVETPRRVFPIRHTARFGILSTLRGTGLRVGGAAAHAVVIQLEVPPAFVPAPPGTETPTPRFPVRYGRVSSVRGSGLVATAAPASASFDRAEYDVTREIAFRAAKASAQLYAEAYPDVSGGVSVTFEEVYPID